MWTHHHTESKTAWLPLSRRGNWGSESLSPMPMSHSWSCKDRIWTPTRPANTVAIIENRMVQGAPEDASGIPGETGSHGPKSVGQQVTLCLHGLRGTAVGRPHCAVLQGREGPAVLMPSRSVSPGNRVTASFIWMSLMQDTLSIQPGLSWGPGCPRCSKVL